LSVDVIPQLLPVINGGDRVPPAQRVQQLAVEERAVVLAGRGKAVETPLAVYHANFKEHAIAGVLMGCGVLFLEMKEALCEGAAVGTEDDLPGVAGCASERMLGNDEGVVDTIEFDGFTGECFDDVRMTEHLGMLAADHAGAVELPGDCVWDSFALGSVLAGCVDRERLCECSAGNKQDEKARDISYRRKHVCLRARYQIPMLMHATRAYREWAGRGIVVGL
jgi:hypothetical protein